MIARRLTLEGWSDDALPTVEGWDRGGDWNGWAKPLATVEALALADENQRELVSVGGEPSVRFEPYGDGSAWVVIPTDDEDRFEIIRPTATTPDGRPLYDLGGLGLCWSWAD